MSTLQFSLFFAALLIAYVLIHVRLVRFESYLKEIVGLKQLNERLKGLADAMDRLRIEPLQGSVGQLHDDLAAVIDRIGELERTLHRDLTDAAVAPQAQIVSVAAPSAEATAGERVRAVVEARLLQLGYRDLRLVSDLSAVRLEDRNDVRVEAMREQMPVKGLVTVRNGAVVDVALQTATLTFP